MYTPQNQNLHIEGFVLLVKESDCKSQMYVEMHVLVDFGKLREKSSGSAECKPLVALFSSSCSQRRRMMLSSL